jgi:hypothetical protein
MDGASLPIVFQLAAVVVLVAVVIFVGRRLAGMRPRP